MPNLESDFLEQKALLWAASATEVNDKGQRKISAAVEMDVRWENMQIEGPDGQGNIVSITAKVVVDRDIAIGSIMWLGTLETVASPPVDLKKVVNFSSIPDIKRRNFRRVVSLTRFSNTLPTLV